MELVEDFKGKSLSIKCDMFHTLVGFNPAQTLKRSGDETVATEIIQIPS